MLALVVGAAVIPAATRAVYSHGASLGIDRSAGFARATPGGSDPIAQPTAGVEHNGRLPRPGAVSKPTELHLTKARSAVFDMRKLHGTVVKRERPEVGRPNEVEGQPAQIRPSVM